MSHTAFNSPLVSREMAPYAWVVIKDDYALRFIGETKEGLYKDIPNGRSSFYEMYNIKNDPGEQNNLIEEKSELFRELESIWIEEAKSFPPPFKTGKDKWDEISPRNNNETIQK